MLKYCIRNLASLISQRYVLTNNLSVGQPLGKRMEMELENVVIVGDELENIKQSWIAEQNVYQARISEKDQEYWKSNFSYLGGLDIIFIVGDDINACACYVVIDGKLEVVYKDTQMVKMIAPYIPGFLAFREAKSLIDLVDQT